MNLTLEDVDCDGALGEAIAALHGSTRAQFLRRAVLGGAALLAASAAPARADEDLSRGDTSILNYALALEYMQDSFYTEVQRLGVLSGKLAEQARVVGAHERAHVKALREALGSRAIKRPHYDFHGATEDPRRFQKTAVAFEDLSVAAYKAQAPLISSREYLVAALGIHSVEARHAAWMRRLAGIVPAATAFDQPRSKRSTLAIIDATHFTMTTVAKAKPRFTG